MRKRILIIILVVLLCVVLHWYNRPVSYSFQQPADCIVKVELLEKVDPFYDTNPFYVRKTIEGETLDFFVNDLQAIPFQRHRSDPLNPNSGDIAIRIYYENGDMEQIGLYGCIYTVSGEETTSSYYLPSEEDFHELFEDYLPRP